MTALVTLIACSLLIAAALLGFFWMRRSRTVGTNNTVQSRRAPASSQTDQS